MANRTEHIKVYLTPEELEKVEEKAEKDDRSVSNFGRHKILDSITAEAPTV